MAIIRTLLIILEAACSLSLIGLILLQKSKNEGLGLAFGSGGGDSLFGARAGNVLTKATVVIGCVFILNTLILGILFAGSSEKSLMDSVKVAQPAPMEQSAMPQQAMPQQAMPTAPVVPAE